MSTDVFVLVVGVHSGCEDSSAMTDVLVLLSLQMSSATACDESTHSAQSVM